MKLRGLVVLLGAALAAAVSCSGNAPVGPSGEAGTGGGAGTSGAAGTFGAAGTTGVAGTSGVAGIVGGTGISGTTGSAGAAGTSTIGCGAFGDPTLASGKCVAGAFKRNGVCSCQSITPNVCDGRCVDVENDDDNCGCCGRACGPTSTCTDGVCGPAAVTFRKLPLGCGQIDLAVASGGIAWTERGRGLVTLATVGGGAELPVAMGEDEPHAPALVGGTVYWLTHDKLRRGDVTTKPTTVLTAAGPINGFVVAPDGFTIYVSTGNEVLRTAINAPPSAVVVAREEHGGIPTALALDEDRIMYPTDLNGDVDVATIRDGKVAMCGIPTESGEPINVDCQRVARSQGSLLHEKIGAIRGSVIWADGSTLKVSSTISLSSPIAFQIATVNGSISGFDVAPNPNYGSVSTTVYVSETSTVSPNAGVIHKYAIAQDQAGLRLARGQNQPRSVAAGTSRVFWSTADCTIESTGL